MRGKRDTSAGAMQPLARALEAEKGLCLGLDSKAWLGSSPQTRSACRFSLFSFSHRRLVLVPRCHGYHLPLSEISRSTSQISPPNNLPSSFLKPVLTAAFGLSTLNRSGPLLPAPLLVADAQLGSALRASCVERRLISQFAYLSRNS